MYRTIKKEILESINYKDVLILLGPRQVGKTTILKSSFNENAIYIDLDDKVYRDFFDSLSIAKYRSYIDSNLGSFGINREKPLILILDEAQRLKDPGLTAKIFYDEIKDVKLILTGSSSLDIRKKTAESLAGRKTTLYLYPLSYQEYLIQKELIGESFITHLNFITPPRIIDDIFSNILRENLLERMRIGLYPGILNTHPETYLKELIEAVILKDIFYLNIIKNTDSLIDLLKILSSMIGESINVSDISKRIGIARQTVNDYISVLEKSYIIFTLNPFRKDRMDEISKYSKIYFYDLGIRNALINDFRPVQMRKDFDNIFKNFVIAEIKKTNTYYRKRYNMYYWKTTQGSELDLVLEKDTDITGIDIAIYSSSFCKGFINTYPDSLKVTMNLNNYHNILI